MVKCPAVKRHWWSMFPRSNVTCGQVFLILVAHQKSRGQMSPRSNVTAVKCPAVKCHWRSKVLRLNVACGQVFLIFVAGQKSHGQMSPRSNVPWSDVTRCHESLFLVKNPAVKCHRGQMSRGQTSLEVKGLAVKCHLRSSFSNLGQKSRGQMSLRSNVPRSNVTGGQMSRGQMSLAVKCPVVKCPAVKCQLRSNVT